LAVIEQVFAFPLLPPAEPGQPEPDIAQQIADALKKRGIEQIDTLVAVGRGSVELRQLQLPAVPDDELPQIVRFQSMMKFNELNERWLLDFMPLDDAEGKDSRNVLAAAIAPDLVQGIEAVCRRGNLKMQHLVLRSCAAASLVARAQPDQRGQVQLLVEMFADQADLTAAVDGKVLFPRTIRWNSNVPHMESLLGGIRLTKAAMQNQFDDCRVARIVLCGSGATDAALARRIEQETETPTVLLDPLAGLELGAPLRESPLESPGRHAAVLGMLLAECESTGHAIDFLHPRQPAPPSTPHRRRTLLAVAAVLLVVAYLAYARIAYWQLESEVTQLESDCAAADALLVVGGKKTAQAKEIAKWADNEVVCLDQFQSLSENFPAAEKAALGRLALTSLSASAGGEARAKMHMEGWARDNETVTALEQGLRARGLSVENSKIHEDRSVQPYAAKFNTTVTVGGGAKP